MECYGTLGYIFALLVILCDLIPVALSLLLFQNQKYQERKTWRDMAALCVCLYIHLSSYMLIHNVLFGHWNFLNMIRDVKAFDFTYQEIVYFPFSLCVRSAMGLVVGYVLGHTGVIAGNRYTRVSRKCIAALYSLILVQAG